MLKLVMFIVFLLSPMAVFAQADGEIHELEGKVWVNGKLANLETEIHFGDQVMTGGLSHVVIKLDGSVYRIANSSKLTLPEGKENVSLNFLYGAFLAVFRHDVHKTIHTRAAILGVRGTGLYLSDRGNETHLCACYGDIDFFDASNPENKRHIHAEYHHLASLDHKTGKFKTNLRMTGHTDEDLFVLEELVGRTPPETFRVERKIFNTETGAAAQ